MRKIIIFFKFILRSKIVFKTPKKHNLIVFDELSISDLSVCLEKFNFFILQTRLEKPLGPTAYVGSSKTPITATKYKIYFSYKILKRIFMNLFKGNLFTVYLISLIELIEPKVVITTIDRSFKFSDVAKILAKKINFIAIQNSMTHDFLNWDHLYNTKQIKHDLIKKLYIPNLFCIGNYDKDMWKKFGVNIKNFHPVGNLRLANFYYHIRSEINSQEKYKSDICLVAGNFVYSSKKNEKQTLLDQSFIESGLEQGLVKLVKYTVKFCIKNNMKLIIPLKKDKKYRYDSHKNEIKYFEKNFDKEEFNYIKNSFLERDRDNFSSYRALINSEVTVSVTSTMLRHKIAMEGKILACNLTNIDRYDFAINGICTLNNCTYEEFEERLLEIHSIGKENYFSKMDKDPNYLEKITKNYSTINSIRKKLYNLGLK